MNGLNQFPSQYTSGLWDKLIFAKLKAMLGGNVRYMVTGSAPIDPNVASFIKICFCVPMVEGYGLTETACAITISHPDDPVQGHVGGPLPSCSIRLKDVPEMGYMSTDKPYPRGEVCVKGPAVFNGYYKNPEKTAECMEKDGWFLTGDVGKIYPNGSIKIIDRSKNIFKLSQGEYIAPEKLENMFMLSPFVAQSMVYGNSFQNNCVAIVVANDDTLKKWAARHSMDPTDAI